MNKLLRATGPITYRLLVVDDGQLGRMAQGRSLKQDIAWAKSGDLTPRYAIFIRPAGMPA